MDKLKAIFAKIIEINEAEITGRTARHETQNWDSFNHLLLISEIEKEFGVNFTASEVENINNFQDLVAALESKTAKHG